MPTPFIGDDHAKAVGTAIVELAHMHVGLMEQWREAARQNPEAGVAFQAVRDHLCAERERIFQLCDLAERMAAKAEWLGRGQYAETLRLAATEAFIVLTVD